MREVIAVRHVHFEDLGAFEDVLHERGVNVRYLDAGQDRLVDVIERRDPDLLVLLGGPVGVYERSAYPFLQEELALVRARISRGRSVLGICLGAQLIAAALGADVHPAGVKEIGWAPIELTPAGAAGPLGALTTPVLHWHGDTFELPAGAVNLASTPGCRNQAFAVGDHILGLQFHAEIRGPAIESWLIGHACEISGTPGVSVAGIRSDTERYASRLEAQGRKFFAAWLDAIPI